MIRRPPRSTHCISSAASDVYKRQTYLCEAELKKLKEITIKDPNFLLKDILEVGKRFVSGNKSCFQYVNYLDFYVNMHRVLKKGSPAEHYGELVIRYSLYTKFSDVVEKALDCLRDPVKDIMKVSGQKSTRSYTCLSFGKKCQKCAKELGECDQYLCAICSPPVHFCLDCLKPRDSIRSQDDLVHPHVFYYLQRDSGPTLDEVRIREISISETEEYSEQCTVRCKACRQEKKVRIVWKCANCENVDLCTDCFNISKDPEHKNHETVRDACAKFRHNVKTHIYVREDIISQLGYHY
eukprot:TRINITY_DN9603_c0_g1_i15.p1 TRINITY_DN9603_c0_g1~~TRINITY_DN9603_c0_g1_i15.p1  ORF type:complete len:304 (+),score=78.59 TRINITY_DN9603_c0_g1_i15:28-912(+)